MQQQVIQIHPDAPPKPSVGARCNGCGVCCLAEPCPVGMLLSRRRTGACVALRWSVTDGCYRCGLLSAPHDVAPRWLWRMAWLRPVWLSWARRVIAAGKGCDADFEVDTSA